VVTKDDIIKELESFSVAKGKTVTVHTSLKAVGEIDGGGETLLDALIEYFTQDGGLLCIPTHTWNSDVYDLRKAESCTGVLSCLAASRKDAVRSLHPTHSVAIFGDRKKAEDFVKDDAFVNTPISPIGCYGKLYAEAGYVLLIGVGHNKNTYLHCVEEMLDVPGRLTDYKVEKTVILPDGTKTVRSIYWLDETICDVSCYFPKFEKPFRFFNCITDGHIGHAPTQLCDARKMKSVIERIYQNNQYKELLHDDKPVDEALYKNEVICD